MLNKLSHKVTNLLLLFILILIILLSFLVYRLIDNKKKETLKIEHLISTFEKKIYNNSINTIDNNVSNDKISQIIIDSITKEYEEKLKFAYANFKIYSTNTNEISTPKNNNEQNLFKENSKKNEYNNVTSYSKLKDFKPSDYTFKKSKHTSNVTTYSKLKNNLDSNQNSTISYNTTKTNNYNNKIVHLNAALNTVKNINDITSSPIFPGCENQTTERSKKNCLATKMSAYLMDNFNTNSFNHINLKKGINNIRVILIINKNGYSRLTKILGNWHPTVIKEVNRVINNMPKMKPGMNNKIKTPVKYSFKIPFIIS